MRVVAPLRVSRWMVPLLSVLSLAAASRDLRLVEAVKKQDKEAVRALLKHKIDVNTPEGDGATALHWTAHRNDLETADLLLRAGARVNAANDYGVTPLSLACTNGNAEMVQKLLAAGANPNATRTTGETVLMRCAHSGNADAVKALLAKGANVNAKESLQEQTALMWAVAQQHPDVVRLLIEHGADINARSNVSRQMYTAGRTGTLAFRTGEVGREIEKGGFTPLLFAARQGDVESARLLLAAGTNVNDAAPDGNSPLVVAAHSGHGRLATFLLEKGADPNAAAGGYAALHSAVLRADLELVEALLGHGANPNAQLTKGTPVPRSAYQWVFTDQLVGATPFLLAAKYNEVEMMRVLAAAGADPLTAIKDGTTPLMAAAGVGWSDTYDRRGRIIAVETINAELANESRTIEAAKLALELGADVNATNAAGTSAMHGAASKGLKTVVQFLIDKGGNPDLKNKGGDTPMDLLRRSRANQSQQQ